MSIDIVKSAESSEEKKEVSSYYNQNIYSFHCKRDISSRGLFNYLIVALVVFHVDI